VSVCCGVLDHEERHLAMQASRNCNAEDLRSGRASAQELARANSFLSTLDLSGFRIGGRGREIVGA